MDFEFPHPTKPTVTIAAVAILMILFAFMCLSLLEKIVFEHYFSQKNHIHFHSTDYLAPDSRNITSSSPSFSLDDSIFSLILSGLVVDTTANTFIE